MKLALVAVPVTAVFCTVPVMYTVPLDAVTLNVVALLLSPDTFVALSPSPGTEPDSCSTQPPSGQVKLTAVLS